jgi:hypothetical protein
MLIGAHEHAVRLAFNTSQRRGCNRAAIGGSARRSCLTNFCALRLHGGRDRYERRCTECIGDRNGREAATGGARLDREFGWSEITAQRYMRVAEAFKSVTVTDFTGLTIDATALYALSVSDVSQSVRDAAIERAEAGEEIGRKLNKAKAKVAHGKWLPWLDAEFGWSQPTASRFMQVAEAFKSFSVNSLAGLTIDATASSLAMICAIAAAAAVAAREPILDRIDVALQRDPHQGQGRCAL